MWNIPQNVIFICFSNIKFFKVDKVVISFRFITNNLNILAFMNLWLLKSLIKQMRFISYKYSLSLENQYPVHDYLRSITRLQVCVSLTVMAKFQNSRKNILLKINKHMKMIYGISVSITPLTYHSSDKSSLQSHILEPRSGLAYFIQVLMHHCLHKLWVKWLVIAFCKQVFWPAYGGFIDRSVGQVVKKLTDIAQARIRGGGAPAGPGPPSSAKKKKKRGERKRKEKKKKRGKRKRDIKKLRCHNLFFFYLYRLSLTYGGGRGLPPAPINEGEI